MAKQLNRTVRFYAFRGYSNRESNRSAFEQHRNSRWSAGPSMPNEPHGVRRSTSMHDPLPGLIKELGRELAERTITVLMPEFVKTTWWQFLLTRTALAAARETVGFGGSKPVIVSS